MLGRVLAPITVAAGMGLASPAFATNDAYSASAQYCEGSSDNCVTRSVDEVSTPRVLGAGSGNNAYAFTSSARGGFAEAAVTFSPSTVTLSAGTYSATAFANVSYIFQVVGSQNTYVPLHIVAQLSASAIHATDWQGNNVALYHDDGYDADLLVEPTGFLIGAYAELQVGNLLANPTAYTFLKNGLYNERLDADSVLIDVTRLVMSNTDITVSLTADATLTYTMEGDADPQYGNVSAETDPVFTIDDPAFSAFRIVGVPESLTAAPEASTWTMIIVGFFAMGVALRCRRMPSRPTPATVSG
jgi:hypothetical protein